METRPKVRSIGKLGFYLAALLGIYASDVTLCSAQQIDTLTIDSDRMTDLEDVLKKFEEEIKNCNSGELSKRKRSLNKQITDTEEEIKATERQISDLEAKRDAERDPAKKAELQKVIDYLKGQLAEKKTLLVVLLAKLGVIQRRIDRLALRIQEQPNGSSDSLPADIDGSSDNPPM